MTFRAKKKEAVYILPIVLILIVTILAGCTVNKSEDKDILLVQYFYYNVCSSCDPEKEFMEQFDEMVGISAVTTDLKIEQYNVFYDENNTIWQKTADKFGIKADKQDFPILRIGDKIRYLADVDSDTGAQNISSSSLYSNSDIPQNASVVVYFSSPGCHDCVAVQEKTLSLLPEEVVINGIKSPLYIINISLLKKNSIDLFEKYCRQYYVKESKQKTPIIFVGGTALSGVEEISKLPSYLFQGEACHTTLYDFDKADENKLSSYNFFGIVATGFLNGLNPCAISMILMLLSLLSVDKKLIGPVGFSFSVGKFVGFLLIGTILFKVIEQIPFGRVAMVSKIVLLILAIIMILFNINDLFAAKREDYKRIRLQLPTYFRVKNHGWIKKFTSSKKKLVVLGGVALGMLVSAGEFLCTGQIYLAVIVQGVNSGAQLSGQALWYLILYCISFISPMIIITILVMKGRGVFGLSDKFRKNMVWVKLFNVIIFIIFFIMILLAY